MNTLTDRYVWGVLRAVPQAQRAELEPEIRQLVADAVDARLRGGADPATAERAALTELGRPELLAARYTGRQLVLIGPRLYPEWQRLLLLLLPIVVPIAAIATAGASYLDGRPASELVGVAIAAGLNVAVQTAFWITLVFALIERSGKASVGREWSPDRLPKTPAEQVRPGVTEVGMSVVALGLLAAVLVWQQVGAPVVIDGTGYALLDPALWSLWIPWFLVVLGLEIAFTLLRWAQGGWTWALAVVNLGLKLAFVVPAVWLVQTDQLFDPSLIAAIEAKVGTAPVDSVVAVGVVVTVAIAAWDTVNGFRKAWIRSRG